MPWASRNALNGEIAEPRSRSSCTRALMMYAGGAESREHHAVVARVGRGEAGELRRCVQSNVAAVDDDAADRRAVAAEVLRRRVHDDVGAVLERPDQVRGRDRVVDDQRHACVVRDVRRRRRCRGCRSSGCRWSRRRTPWCSGAPRPATTRGRPGPRRRSPRCRAWAACSGTGCRCRRRAADSTRCGRRPRRC